MNVDAIITLLEKCTFHLPNLDMDWYREYLNTNVLNRVVFAEYDPEKPEKCTGVAVMFTDPYELNLIAVDPDYRHRGIAQGLESKVISMVPKGCTIGLDTFREGDPRGEAVRHLHIKMGFIPGELNYRHGVPQQHFTLEV